MFFYFYFKYTAQYFDNQDALIKALNKMCNYEKNTAFFRKCKGLHSYFEKNGGSLEAAIHNADRSLERKDMTGNDYTYSEIGRMLELLRKIIDHNKSVKSQ